VIRNAKTGDLRRTRNRRAVLPDTDKQRADVEAQTARLAEIGRKYTLKVIVTDLDGREVLNVTKVALKRDMHDEGNAIPEIRDVLELLIEAAEEHVLPFE
jgi:hypothetical protein